MKVTLAELADRFSLQLQGDGHTAITGLASLGSAQAGQLCYLADKRYRPLLDTCRAAAVLLKEADAGNWNGPALLSAHPAADFARIASLFDPIERPSPGLHESASVDAAAVLGRDVHVGSNAVIQAGARIGDGTVIGPGCVIGRNVEIGEDSWLTANVTIYDGVRAGARVHIQPGAAIGGRGFGLEMTKDGWLEVPQIGSVVIGDDVEVGANTCIDRGALEDTVIENGVKIDNLVQVGHNTYIGERTAIAGCVGIAGSSRIGKRCQIGGAVGIAGQLEIADDVVITAFSLVSNSIDKPGLYSASLPVAPASEWRRQVARLRNIDELHKRVKILEKNQGNG